MRLVTLRRYERMKNVTSVSSSEWLHSRTHKGNHKGASGGFHGFRSRWTRAACGLGQREKYFPCISQPLASFEVFNRWVYRTGERRVKWPGSAKRRAFQMSLSQNALAPLEAKRTWQCYLRTALPTWAGDKPHWYPLASSDVLTGNEHQHKFIPTAFCSRAVALAGCWGRGAPTNLRRESEQAGKSRLWTPACIANNKSLGLSKASVYTSLPPPEV